MKQKYEYYGDAMNIKMYIKTKTKIINKKNANC
jgi:hypothetical protein